MLRQDKTNTLILALFAGLLFINTLWNDFTLDDVQVIQNSPFLTGEGGWSDLLKEGRPIRTVSLMLDYKVFGRNPEGYHLQNIFWHLSNTVLLYFFALRIKGRKFAFIVSILFASHPIHVESVANISNRKDLLLFFFMLSSLLLYIRSYDSHGLRKILLICGASLAFVLALLSKQGAVVLPLIIIAYELYFVPEREKRLFLCNILYFSPLILLFLLYGLQYVGPVIRQFALSHVSYSDVLFTSIKSTGYYCQLLLWPVNLSADHVIDTSKTIIELRAIISLLILAAILWLIVKTRWSAPLVSFGLLWFIINLLPVSNLIPGTAGFFVAERYMYVPSAGFIIVSGTLFSKASAHWKRGATALFLGVIFFFSLNTVNRNTIWRNDLVLWKDTLKKDPDSLLAKINMGDIYRSNDMPEKAIPYYKGVLIRLPSDPGIRNNLGLAYMKLGRYDEAMLEYEKVLQVDPDFSPSLYGLAEIYTLKGRYNDAVKLYEKILDIKDYNRRVSVLLKSKVHLQLGMLYSKMGLKKEALEELKMFVSEWKGRKEEIELALDEIEKIR